LDTFVWPVRVYYEDTDSGGVVYHANYLSFMERARTEWLRGLGFEQDRLRNDGGVIFAVHSLSAEYHRPARFNDLLQIDTRIIELRRASLSFQQTIRRDADDQLLCSGKVKVACVDAQRMRPAPLPEALLERIRHVD
jgi:acyl-CoA thioester hydrolase